MSIVASGDWWSLDDAGHLEIFCVGDMPAREWNDYLTDILTINIADGVSGISNRAFWECSSLTSVTIPNSVTAIGYSVFSSCSALASITIPYSVTEIGEYAFAQCSSLTSVTIPDGVAEIKAWTFALCSVLASVTIPDSVTNIRNGAFQSCAALTDVYYTGTEAQWNAVSVESNNAPLLNATVHYHYAPPVPLPLLNVGNIGNPLAAVARCANQLTRAVLQVRDNAAALQAIVNAKAEASAVSVLIGGDAGKSARTIAAEELAAQLIPANAQEALDTLQEIAAWIQSHPDDAAAMNAKLTLGTNAGVEYPTVKAYVEAVTAGLIKMADLSAATNGAGNAVTGVIYNNATGAFTFSKGATFLTDHQDISGKVDKVTGKGLSTEDYTTAEKNKLSGIASGATANAPATAAPLMDGTAAVGTSIAYARGDHAHPTDTSRASAADMTDLQADMSDAQDAISALQAENAVLRNLIEHVDAPIYFTEFGNPVTFSDGYPANVKTLTVTLTPTQSAAPSVESPVPIDGCSSVTVRRSGKNLAAPNYGFSQNGLSIGADGHLTGSVSLVAWWDNLYSMFVKNGASYAASRLGVFPVGRLNFGHSGISSAILRSDYGTSRAFAGTSDDGFRTISYCSDYGFNAANAPYPTDFAFQVEIGSAATEYEPYDGQTVTVPLVDFNDNPLTVYGGVLTLTPSAATLTVTHGCIDSYDGETVPDGWISSTGELSAGAQVVYPLASADYQTYQLTAAQLATRSGYNVIAADAGTLSVTYRADPSITLGGAS